MKNTNTRQAVTYLGAGALLAIIVLFLMGRFRSEGYIEQDKDKILNTIYDIKNRITRSMQQPAMYRRLPHMQQQQQQYDRANIFQLDTVIYLINKVGPPITGPSLVK